MSTVAGGESKDLPLPSSIKWASGKSSSDADENDWQTGYFAKETLAGTHRIHLSCLQCHMVTSDGIFTLFSDVWLQAKNTY